MITAEYRGGMGNNMFQRGIAEIFSKENGVSVNDANLPRDLKGVICPVGGINKEGPKVELNDDILYGKTNFLRHLYSNHRQMHFNGFFQRSFLFLDHRDYLKSFFKLPLSVENPKDNDVAVMIRRGNVTGSKYAIPYEYYDYVLGNFLLDSIIHIFTDTPSDVDVVKLYGKYKSAEIVCGDKRNDMGMITKFKTIVAGSGSYHWWSIFLSSASKVYLPLHNEGWGFDPNQKPLIDLYLPFSDYIHCSKYGET